ncbi:MAG: 1-deoxy-D-xylulose-5-phosphate reductoisomerase [Thiotrichaceae bacterium]|nr:1-deoxy-D-xylulose-5-phosphate reductoisomerase [Thiotrichaceae bacterium]
MIRVCILGATGSIGVSTLDVIKQHAHQFKVVALTANQDVERLFQQCVEFLPSYAVMADAAAAEQLAARLAHFDEITVLSGVEGLKHVASLPEVDTVMAAIVGGAGLLPTLAAAQAGKRVLLANKEALVMSGQLFLDAVHQHGAQLLPIDSEHNAIFQCMPASFTQHGVKNLTAVGVSRILLTASGGPFRNYPLEQLGSVTPEQACNHPKWKMGRKISVDSATMMNKGLEVIEACWLFNTPPERIEVLIHPQSVIHSMVEYVDGSTLAQLGNPDMRTPIAHALAFPERMTSGVARLNLLEIAKLEFEPMDFARFPCLRLAYEAMQAGGTTTAILNAANEIAVEAFLAGKLRFTAIAELIEQTLSRLNGRAANTLEIILEDDTRARQLAEELLTTL